MRENCRVSYSECVCLSFWLSRSSFNLFVWCFWLWVFFLFVICMKNLMQSRAFTSGREQNKKRLFLYFFFFSCVFLSVCLRVGKESQSILFATFDLNFSVHTHTCTPTHQTRWCFFIWMGEQFEYERNTTTTMTATTTTTELINPNSKAKHNLLTPFWRRYTYTSIFGCRPFYLQCNAHSAPFIHYVWCYCTNEKHTFLITHTRKFFCIFHTPQ